MGSMVTDQNANGLLAGTIVLAAAQRILRIIRTGCADAVSPASTRIVKLRSAGKNENKRSIKPILGLSGLSLKLALTFALAALACEAQITIGWTPQQQIDGAGSAPESAR